MTDQRGFTLVEVLVALVILVLALTELVSRLDAGFRADSVTTHQQAAVEAARTLMAGLGHVVPLQEGTFEGDLPPDQHWRLLIHPLPHGNQSTGLHVPQAYTVHLTMSWRQRGEPVSLEFDTIRLGSSR